MLLMKADKGQTQADKHAARTPITYVRVAPPDARTPITHVRVAPPDARTPITYVRVAPPDENTSKFILEMTTILITMFLYILDMHHITHIMKQRYKLDGMICIFILMIIMMC